MVRVLLSPRFKHWSRKAVLLGFFSGAAWAQTTIQVPQDASSIQSGIDRAKRGDTVLVAPGTYNENIDFHGKEIIVTSGAKSSEDAGSTIISGTLQAPVVKIGSGEGVGAVLNGFTITNGQTVAILVKGASPTLSNNIVLNNKPCGIVVSDPTSNPTIVGNIIRGTTTSASNNCEVIPPLYVGAPIPGSALSLLEAGTVQILNNTIEENGRYDAVNRVFFGIAVSIQLSQDVLLKNNIVRHNNGTSLNVWAAKRMRVIQNLIVDNQQSDLAIAIYTQINNIPPNWPREFAIEFVNNTIARNTVSAGGSSLEASQAKFFGSFMSSTIANNLFISANNAGSVSCSPKDLLGDLFPIKFNNNGYFDVAGQTQTSCDSGSAAASNLFVDPRFENADAGNYHLQRDSPVVGAGDFSAPDLPSADLDERARTVCGKIDMGAYQTHPQPLVTLKSSPNPSSGGSNVAFYTAVSGNCNTPTGTISILDGGTRSGSAPINPSGDARLDTSSLVVGSHNITASYSGDFNFDSSVSPVLQQIVTGYPTSTALDFVSPNPARAFGAINLHATVTSGFGVPAGTINFLANGRIIASAPADGNGVAVASIDQLGAGDYSVTASYAASTTFAASSSSSAQLKVLGTDTATTISSSSNPIAQGETVLLSAHVSPRSGTYISTGTVSFQDGAASLGVSALNSAGVAVLSVSTLRRGSHSIVARYDGSSNFNASASTPLLVTVTAIPTSVDLNISPNPSSKGKSVTMMATVVAGASGEQLTGNVSFSDQNGLIGVAQVIAGVATFTTSGLSTGVHDITANFESTGDFAHGVSNTVKQIINDFNFTLSVSATDLQIPSGDHKIILATVTPTGGYPGRIKFTCDSLPIHAQCQFDPSTTIALSNGPQTVKVWIDTSDVLGYGEEARTRVADSQIAVALLLPLILLGHIKAKIPNYVSRKLMLFLFASSLIIFGCVACTGKLPGATAPGTYRFNIIGHDLTPDTGLSHQVEIVLNVK